MRLPREMAERRRVMRKCVFCSSSELVGEEDDGVSGGGEAARAATVREAAVPLWAERTVRREFRSLLAVRAGRARLSIGVSMRRRRTEKLV